MNAGDICNRDVVTVEGDASVVEAARLMRERHVGDLIVVEERANGVVPVGIITDRDIVICVVARDVPEPEALMVSDMIAAELITAQEDESIADVVKRMRKGGVRRVPVVDGRGALKGVVSFDDVIDFLASVMNDLTDLIGRQMNLERERRD